MVSFERCVFRLSHGSVGFLLQASLGGSADVFCVSQLADRVFRFSVYSKTVGFHISMLKIIDRPEFRAFSVFGILVVRIGYRNSEIT